MPRKTKAPVAPQNVARDVWLREQLAGLESDIGEAQESRSWQAVAALRRQAHATRDALDQVIAATAQHADPTADLSDEELVAGLVSVLGALPDHVVERVEDAIAARWSGRPALAVLPGGNS